MVRSIKEQPMDDVDNILKIIVVEFPKYRDRITTLYHESSNFLETCEDYVLCLEAIKKFELINDQKNERELIDLKLARTDLREELLSKI